MKKIKFRLQLVILFMLLFPSIVIAQDQVHTEKVSLQLQWKHQFEFAGFYAAKEKGYYANAGLEVNIREYKKGKEIIASVLAGKATFGTLYSSSIRARMEGKPVMLLANYFKRSPLAFAVKPDIYFPGDLKGKKVMGEKHELESANFSQMFQQFNMTVDDFTVVPHAFGIDKFVNNEVDAMTVFLTNEIYDLRQKKVPFNIIDPNNYGVPLYDVTLFTSESLANKRPAMVKAFIDASNKGWEYALANPEEIVDLILAKYNSQNKSREHLLYEAHRTQRMIQPDIYPIGSIDPERIKKIEELFASEGVAKSIVPPENFIFGLSNPEKINLTSAEQAFLKRKPSIKVVKSFHQPPFTVYEGSSVTGYLYDLLTEVIRIAGFKTQYIEGGGTYDGMVEAVAQGAADLLPNMNSTRQLADSVAKTVPVVTTPNVLVAKIGAPQIRETFELFGKKVAVVKGYAQDQHLDRFPQIHKVHVASNDEGFKAVRMDKAEYFLNNLANAAYILEETFATDLQISGELTYTDFPPLSLSFAIHQKHPELPTIINKALAAVPLETRSRLRRKWLIKASSNVTPLNVEIDLTPEERDFLADHPVVRVSNEMDWPPFDFAIGKKPQGFSIDMFKLIAKRIGIDVKFVNGYTWDELWKMFERKELDVVHPIIHNKYRENFALFSKPLYGAKFVFVTKANRPVVQSIEDIKGKVMALPKGWGSIAIMKENFPDIKILLTNNLKEALDAVKTDKAYATFDMDAVLGHLLKKNVEKDLKINGLFSEFDSLQANRYYYGIRKDWPLLHQIIMKAQDSIMLEEIEELEQKWFGKASVTANLTTEEQDYIQDHPVITATNEQKWAPFNFFEEGQPKGFSIDYLNLLADKVGLKVNYISGPSWKEFVKMTKRKEVDVLLNVAYNLKRTAWLEYSKQAYLSVHYGLVVNTGLKNIRGFKDILDKTIAVEDGFWMQNWFKENHPNVHIVPYKNTLDALRAVSFNEALSKMDFKTVIPFGTPM